MRISDWSSDVCSSDLPAIRLVGKKIGNGAVFVKSLVRIFVVIVVRSEIADPKREIIPTAVETTIVFRDGVGDYNAKMGHRKFTIRDVSIISEISGFIGGFLKVKGIAKIGTAVTRNYVGFAYNGAQT